MEDKKLNLNQPLLSVRKNPSNLSSERIDDGRIEDFRRNIPRLPRYKSELKSGPVRNPGAVPFQWEQTPGQPKNEIRPKFKNSDRPPVAPKLPPGRYPKASQKDFHHLSPSTVDKKEELAVNLPIGSITGPSLYEGNRDVGKCKEVTEESGSSTLGDWDEAYVDAPDTLCRTESSLLNCSVSGLSGLDDLDGNTTGSFSTDPQTREFMMDRFLPAAKAMASEIPHSSKKQSTVQEQLKQKTVSQERPTLRYGPSFAKRYSHFCDNERDEEEESDDEYDHQQSSPAVCGLLPRFCLKGSIYLLNPVPSMSVRTRAQFSPATRARPRSSSSGSFTENLNEKLGMPQLKQVGKTETAEDEEKKAILKNGIAQLDIHNQLMSSDAPPPVTGNKKVLALLEETETAEFRGFKAFQEFLADKELESGGSVIERTVYVDTVRNVETKRPFSPNAQDIGVLSSRKEMDKMHVLDSSLEDLKKLAAMNWEATMPAKSYEFSDSNVVSSTETENMETAESKASEDLEKQLLRATTLDNCQKRCSQLPVPPPLPKSPSDSWLFRTLPSISSKNASARLFFGATTKPQNLS